jgi:hypothetical protein
MWADDQTISKLPHRTGHIIADVGDDRRHRLLAVLIGAATLSDRIEVLRAYNRCSPEGAAAGRF